MTTKSRILSAVLSLLMVVALFAPIGSVFAAESLEIIAASDNGGTTSTSGAEQAVAGLGTGTTWYSANRNNLTDKISIATFTLRQVSTVESVGIAFYNASTRIFQYSVEYSVDNSAWSEAVAKTWSVQQNANRDIETITFSSAVEALYLRVKIYDAQEVASGSSNNYGAFYTFAAQGQYKEGGALAPADTTELNAAMAKFEDLNSDDYYAESWAKYTTLKEKVDALGTAPDYSKQETVNTYAAEATTVYYALEYCNEPSVLEAVQTNGPSLSATTVPTVTVAKLRDSIPGAQWYTANAANFNGGAPATSETGVQVVYTFAREVELESIAMAWYMGHQRQYRFKLEYSMDGSDWKTLKDWGVSGVVSADGEYDADYSFDTVNAVYVRVTASGHQPVGGSWTNYVAYHGIQFVGVPVEDGAKPLANYDEFNNWVNVYKDLTESLYTTDSWAALKTAASGVQANVSKENQAIVDAATKAISDAYYALEFANLNELQIAQSYWSDLGGENAWTNGAILFTEPGYCIDQYKVGTMTLATWVRIYGVPTAEEGIYEISNIIGAFSSGSGTTITADEVVPENDYGTGFILAMHVSLDDSIADGSESQYASQEFGNRNAAAYAAMDLKPGDKVQLNNVIFTEADFEAEGEEMQAAWLETTGTWKHRYWDTEGLGEFSPSAIYRKSNKVNPEAVEGGPQYLARDQFDDFTTTSTLTKVEGEAYVSGDVDGDEEVGVNDLTVLAQYLAGWTVEINAPAADVDGDEEVGVNDLTVLAQYLAGWDVTLG